MNTENVLECAAYFTPVEMKIINLVAEGVKIKRIAKALRMDKRAVQRHIDFIGKIIREVCNILTGTGARIAANNTQVTKYSKIQRTDSGTDRKRAAASWACLILS